jgi:hypothetical protein
MRTLAVAPRQKRVHQNAIKTATAREFNGGWNVIDNELNLNTSYGVVMDNVSRGLDGSIRVRWGTQFLADAHASAARIINITYYQASIIIVLSDGKIVRMLGDGTKTTYTVAAPGWSTNVEFVSFATFNGDLIICNGIDKPLIANWDPARVPVMTPPIQFLKDLGSGNNQFVPIARYVSACNRFLLMAGDPLYPARVHISEEGTSGTWFGAAGTINATFKDLGASGIPGDQIITGLNNYRDRVVVGFPSAIVLGQLSIYDDANKHIPKFDDVIENIGSHSHRCMVNIGKDMLMLDDNGVPSIARSLLSGSVEPKRVSELIDPAIGRNMGELATADTLLRTHAVYNPTDKQYMCFVPNHTEANVKLTPDPLQVSLNVGALRIRWHAHNLLPGEKITLTGVTAWNTIDITDINGVQMTVVRVINSEYFEVAPTLTPPPNPALDRDGGGSNVIAKRWRTETYGYIYTFVDELKVKAWSRFRGWRWNASCVSEAGAVIFANDKSIFILGNPNNPVYSDAVTATTVKPIDWVYEQPWNDVRDRLRLKHTRYLAMDTVGTAPFTAMQFCDQIYKIEGVLQPNTIMEMVGGSSGGYGEGGQPYGGGRNTSDERLYAWTNHFKIGKLRFQGSSNEPLQIISISLAYQTGDIRR